MYQDERDGVGQIRPHDHVKCHTAATSGNLALIGGGRYGKNPIYRAPIYRGCLVFSSLILFGVK